MAMPTMIAEFSNNSWLIVIAVELLILIVIALLGGRIR